jgi:glycosyltransferase involved in cell wall biosynthesis
MAQQLRAAGVDAGLVVITRADPLDERLRAMGVPYATLGLARGKDVIGKPREYARCVAEVGVDAALLMTSGFMASALRLGGYRGRLVGIEHGHSLQLLSGHGWRRRIDRADLALGARALDSQVAVSHFMLQQLRRLPHHAAAVVIPNGVNLDHFRPITPAFDARDRPVVGWAGRMVPGKGVDDLLHAMTVDRDCSFDVHLAGDGPERSRLEALAVTLGVADRVQFQGRRQDMATFWNDCDVAVAPSNTFVESFGMAPLEASACGRAVVATRNGGFVDVVVDGITGRLVPPGDVSAMGAAIATYVRDPDRARVHGASGRERAVARFGISACAATYLNLVQSL